jgi:hypothetical protein
MNIEETSIPLTTASGRLAWFQYQARKCLSHNRIQLEGVWVNTGKVATVIIDRTGAVIDNRKA